MIRKWAWMNDGKQVCGQKSDQNTVNRMWDGKLEDWERGKG